MFDCKIFIKFLTLNFIIGSIAVSLDLVSEKTIQEQERLTTSHKLKNGIPLHIRSVPESDLYSMVVTINSGYKDNSLENRVLGRLMWAVLSQASKKYPREKFREITEKYALKTGCGENIEFSNCAISGVADFWGQGLDLFTDMLLNPAFTKEDFDQQKELIESSLNQTPADPSGFTNDIVNQVFYADGHPYLFDYKVALEHLAKTTIEDLKKFHREIVTKDTLSIVFVGNIKTSTLINDLDKAFDFSATSDFKPTSVSAPVYQPNLFYNFEHRDIPTAYMRFKFNSVGMNHKDYAASVLLFNILSEELTNEIRTNLSLSYSVYAFPIAHSIGVGSIGASTSKPKETLEAMNRILTKIKNTKLSQEELDEYKVEYSTKYFLGLETHASLASIIARSIFYFNNTELAYRFPKMISDVNSDDIHRLANEILNDFWFGAIFHKDKFKKEWVDQVVSANRRK